MIRDIWGLSRDRNCRDLSCPGCAQELHIYSVGGSLYELGEPWETTSEAVKRTGHAHGGARKGSGPKPRTDGRDWFFLRAVANEQEKAKILDKTTPDSRRKILMTAIEAGKGTG